MKFLILHGTANSGKTECVKRFCDYLKLNGWEGEAEKLGNDIRIVLKKKINGTEKHVILCSGSDTEDILRENKRFVEKNNPCDILVLAQRLDDPLNKIFEKYFPFVESDRVLIVPMAHISGRYNDCLNMLQRYKDEIDKLTQKLFFELI